MGITDRLIELVGRVFVNDPRDRGSIPGRVLPKTQKMVRDTSLLNTKHYKLHIKGKEWRHSQHLVVVAIEKGSSGSPSTTVANCLKLYNCVKNICIRSID